jgi:hypothetical protein
MTFQFDIIECPEENPSGVAETTPHDEENAILAAEQTAS